MLCDLFPLRTIHAGDIDLKQTFPMLHVFSVPQTTLCEDYYYYTDYITRKE
jgi:hypothetical protein